MELFVYVRMGGTPEDSVIKVLDDKGLLTLEESLANFDAAKAGCYLSSDRQRLLGVIEATFGTCAPFNKLIKEMFSQKLAGDNPVWGVTRRRRPSQSFTGMDFSKRRSSFSKQPPEPVVV